MKLTSNEINTLIKMRERIDKMKSDVADRSHHTRDTKDIETDATIDGLCFASEGIEQAIEQQKLLINIIN